MRIRTVVLVGALLGGSSAIFIGAHYLISRAALNRWRSSVLVKQRVGNNGDGWEALIEAAAADPRCLESLNSSIAMMSDSQACAAADFAWHFSIEHPTSSAFDLTMRLYHESSARDGCLEYLIFAWASFPCVQTLDVLVEVASSPNVTRRQRMAAVRSIGLACRDSQRGDAQETRIRATVEPMVQSQDAELVATAMLCLIRSRAVGCSSAEEYRHVLALVGKELGAGDARVKEIDEWIDACLKER